MRNATDGYQLLKSIEAHTGFVRSLLVAGDFVYSGGMNRDVKIWDSRTLALIKTIEDEAVTQSFPVSVLVKAGKHVLAALSDRLVLMHDQ